MKKYYQSPEFKDFNSFLNYCKEEIINISLDDIKKGNYLLYDTFHIKKNELETTVFQSDIDEIEVFAKKATKEFHSYLNYSFTGGSYKGKYTNHIPPYLIEARMYVEYLNLYNEALNKNINGSQEDNSILPKKKVKKEKRLEDYFQNITDFGSFIKEIENSFYTDKGKTLIGVIKLLKDEDLLIIQDRELKPFYNCWKESTTKIKLPSYEYIIRVLKEDPFHKEFLDPIKSKLDPIIRKYKIKAYSDLKQG